MREVRLENGADLVEPALSEPTVDAERRVDELRLLHVDPDEAAAFGCVLDEQAHVLEREFFVDLEPEVRQLQRGVGAEVVCGDPVEHGAVGPDDVARLARLEHALAEQRRVGIEALVVQRSQHSGALVERFARDEASGAEPLAVAPDEPLHARAVRGGEDPLAERRIDRAVQLCDSSHSFTSCSRRASSVKWPSAAAIQASTPGIRAASQRPWETGTKRSSVP